MLFLLISQFRYVLFNPLLNWALNLNLWFFWDDMMANVMPKLSSCCLSGRCNIIVLESIAVAELVGCLHDRCLFSNWWLLLSDLDCCCCIVVKRWWLLVLSKRIAFCLKKWWFA
jgi:hypothetical protein